MIHARFTRLARELLGIVDDGTDEVNRNKRAKTNPIAIPVQIPNIIPKEEVDKLFDAVTSAQHDFKPDSEPLIQGINTTIRFYIIMQVIF